MIEEAIINYLSNSADISMFFVRVIIYIFISMFTSTYFSLPSNCFSKPKTSRNYLFFSFDIIFIIYFQFIRHFWLLFKCHKKQLSGKRLHENERQFLLGPRYTHTQIRIIMWSSTFFLLCPLFQILFLCCVLFIYLDNDIIDIEFIIPCNDMCFNRFQFSRRSC